jgi:serine/threonine protein kinase
MHTLSHPNIVRLLAVCLSSMPAFLVMEYMPRGDLKRVLSCMRNHTPEQLMQMCLQVARALQYLHSAKYVHRDVAARNVLVDDDDSLKLSDFGLVLRTD